MNTVPPPLGSPQTKDEIPDTPTGRYRALKKEFKVEKIFTVSVAVLALLVSMGSIFGGYRVLLSDAKAQTKEQMDAGLKDVSTRVDSLEKNQAAVMTELRETRLDLKELYKANRYDRPSPRLEAPLKPLAIDGGP